MDLERGLADEVERTLRGTDITFQREIGLAGSRVDFLVLGPWGGPAAALELKAISANYPADRMIITQLQAQTYTEFLRGIRVLIVVPDSAARRFRDLPAIVGVSDLVARLQPLLAVRASSGQH